MVPQEATRAGLFMCWFEWDIIDNAFTSKKSLSNPNFPFFSGISTSKTQNLSVWLAVWLAVCLADPPSAHSIRSTPNLRTFSLELNKKDPIRT